MLQMIVIIVNIVILIVKIYYFASVFCAHDPDKSKIFLTLRILASSLFLDVDILENGMKTFLSAS